MDNWKRQLSGNYKLIIERYCMSVMKILGVFTKQRNPWIRKIPHLLILSRLCREKKRDVTKIKICEIRSWLRYIQKEQDKKKPLCQKLAF